MASKFLLNIGVMVIAVSSVLTGAPLQLAQNYVIGPKDVIAILCLDDPALTGRFTVEADGTFSLPYLGSVKAAKLTVRQFEEAIKKSLQEKRFFKNPQITVTIDQYRSQNVILMGEVGRPGQYPLTGGMTLLDLIANAGALTPAASRIILIVPAAARAEVTGDGAGQPGAAANADPAAASPDSGIVRADFSQLFNGVLDRRIELHDGDIVIATQAERVYILGEVKSPGAHAVQLTTTVQQLLAVAGGQTVDAALNRIKITRFENGATVELKNVKLTELVKPGDTVIVPTKRF